MTEIDKRAKGKCLLLLLLVVVVVGIAHGTRNQSWKCETRARGWEEGERNVVGGFGKLTITEIKIKIKN